MAKGLFLLGFALYFSNLCFTGDLQKYINMRYAYMVYFAIGALVVLAVAQFWQASKMVQEALPIKEAKTNWKKTMTYWIFALPLFTGFIFPVATLNSFTAMNKGINFPVKDGSSWQKYNQILQPDSSIYYGQDFYNKRMTQNLQMMQNQSVLKVNDSNYFSMLETLYKNEKLFQGKPIEISGFAFHDKNLPPGEPFLLRYGLIHCILDSGIYGLRLELPAGTTLQTDSWYTVKGVVSEAYYAPVQGVIPCVTVQQVQKIPQPSDPYVYFNTN